MAEKFDLKIISIEDLVAYRMEHDSLIKKKQDFQIETRFGDFRLRAYQQTTNDSVHIALTKGTWSTNETVPTRINSSLVNNDVLGTLTNNADRQLDGMFKLINKHGKGAIIFINQKSQPTNILKRLEAVKNIQEVLNRLWRCLSFNLNTMLDEFNEELAKACQIGQAFYYLMT